MVKQSSYSRACKDNIFSLVSSVHRKVVLWEFCLITFCLLSSLPTSAQDSTVFLQPSAREDILLHEVPSATNVSKYTHPVYAASKETQPVTEAPSSVTIITADEIKKYGYRTLADILQSVNGFYVTSDRNYSYVGVRGFNRPGDYNTRILLLVDGHRLNDNVYEQAEIGTEAPLDVDLIDRVEIIRGPGSSLYGTNAFFAVINILTKRGRDLKGVELSTGIGSYESYKGRFSYGERLQNGLEFLVSGSFLDSAGHRRLFFKEFDSPATNNGIARNADGDRVYHLFTKSSFADFTFQGAYTYRRKILPTAPYETVFNTTRTHTVDEHGYLDLTYSHQFASQWQLMTRLYYDRYYYRGDYLYNTVEAGTSNFVLNQDTTLGEQWGTEIKLTKRWSNKHNVTLGGEYRDNFHQHQRNYDVNPFFSYLHDKRNSTVWAFYIQDEFSLLDNLLLNVGFRYDRYRSFGSTINPRFALIYNLRQTSLKLLYGEAFRAPNAYEQFYATLGYSKANPHLKPETIKTYEVVIEHNLGTHLRASIAGYYYTVDGLISQQLDPNDGLTVFQNAGDLEAKGLELNLDGKWDSGIEGRVEYALQRTEDAQTHRSLTNSPQHMLKTGLSIPVLQEKLFVSLEARYMSTRRTLAGHYTNAPVITNLTLFGQNFYRGVEVSGSIYNLFDQSYGDPGSTEHRQDVFRQDGRTFWLKLQYRF